MTVVMEHARLQGPSSALDQRVMATSDSAPSTVVKSPFRPVDDHCVYAADFIPVDSQSHLIHLEQMDGHWFTRKHLAVSLNADGQLTCPSNAHWPMSMEVALECRAQNVECVLLSNNTLVFTTTKIIDKNQRLYFWFSEMLLAQLEMPFLVPKNIQGGDRYVCHRCPAIFSTPNPLKLHLFFQCSPVSLTSLWGRVRQLLVKNRSADSAPLTPRSTNLFLTPIDGTALPNPANFAISAASTCRPLAPARAPLTSPAEVESLVSNLGRSKHGHICIYCGKIYSRKYGLKIHIRTHTGYKPLKCPVCTRPFGDPSNLNKHIRLHSDGDTPYKCELCGKVLVRRRDLDRHLKSRHPLEALHCLSPSSAMDGSSDNDDDDDEDVDVC